MKVNPIVILSKTIDDNYKNMLEQCIKSYLNVDNSYFIIVENDSRAYTKLVIDKLCLNHNYITEMSHFFYRGNSYRYIYVIDSVNNNQYCYINYDEPFNYNKALNIANYYIKNYIYMKNIEHVIYSNNDVIAKPDFYNGMIESFSLDKSLISLSPYTPNWHCHNSYNTKKLLHYGYKRSYEFTGWCHIIKPEFLNIIDSFDENIVFHYSDDDLVNTMKQENIKHALSTLIEVTHLTSFSHDLIPVEKRNEYLYDDSYYKKKWNIK